MSDDLTIFLQQAFNGLSLSGIYILLAVGISLSFGLTRIVNFAHGQMFLLGGFLTIEFIDVGLGFALAVILAGLAVGAFGVLVDRALLRHTLDVPLNGFIISLGLILVLEVVMQDIWGDSARQVPRPIGGVWDVGGVIIAKDRVMILAVTSALIAGLFALLRWTSLGRAMRACAEDREASSLSGINVGRTITFTFFLGTLMAGIGGGLLGVLISFTPFASSTFVVKGFMVAIIGGLGNVTGAVVGGLLLGMTETMGVAYWQPEWQHGFGYALLILVVLFRPSGLFGGTDISTILKH